MNFRMSPGVDVGMVDQVDDRGDRLAQVVRRDVRRHADRDARRAVHDEVGHARRQDAGLLEPIVEVGDEVDGVLVEIGQQLHRDRRELGLGVTVRRGGIALDGAEVSLPVHQRIAQREILHHAHERVVHALVAVRVILAEHVADDGRALLVRAARHQSELVHRVQHAPMHRLEAVAHVGQCARHDHAHRVVDERLPDLVVDQARKNAFAIVRSSHDSATLGGLHNTDLGGLSQTRNIPERRAKSNVFARLEVVYLQRLNWRFLRPDRGTGFR